jgi:4-hydroxybenzoate polyprenyltransferase
MSENKLNIREFVVATATAVFLGVVLSMGAVYGLNRYFDQQHESATAFAVPPRGP